VLLKCRVWASFKQAVFAGRVFKNQSAQPIDVGFVQ
jgi:hypothetical protein